MAAWLNLVLLLFISGFVSGAPFVKESDDDNLKTKIHFSESSETIGRKGHELESSESGEIFNLNFPKPSAFKYQNSGNFRVQSSGFGLNARFPDFSAIGGRNPGFGAFGRPNNFGGSSSSSSAASQSFSSGSFSGSASNAASQSFSNGGNGGSSSNAASQSFSSGGFGSAASQSSSFSNSFCNPILSTFSKK